MKIVDEREVYSDGEFVREFGNGDCGALVREIERCREVLKSCELRRVG